MWVVVNIGCIECGCESGVVLVTEDLSRANTEASRLNGSRTFNWRGGGQNSYEVFELPVKEELNPEYASSTPGEPIES